MRRLRCADYGFECKFVAYQDDKNELIEDFGSHMLNEHGIEYSKEALMQVIIRKYSHTY